jgi:hypothetical protein
VSPFIAITVVHIGLAGPVEQVERMGACYPPPLHVPVTLDHRGCYRLPRCSFVCEPAPFVITKMEARNEQD